MHTNIYSCKMNCITSRALELWTKLYETSTEVLIAAPFRSSHRSSHVYMFRIALAFGQKKSSFSRWIRPCAAELLMPRTEFLV